MKKLLKFLKNIKCFNKTTREFEDIFYISSSGNIYIPAEKTYNTPNIEIEKIDAVLIERKEKRNEKI